MCLCERERDREREHFVSILPLTEGELETQQLAENDREEFPYILIAAARSADGYVVRRISKITHRTDGLCFHSADESGFRLSRCLSMHVCANHSRLPVASIIAVQSQRAARAFLLLSCGCIASLNLKWPPELHVIDILSHRQFSPCPFQRRQCQIEPELLHESRFQMEKFSLAFMTNFLPPTFFPPTFICIYNPSETDCRVTSYMRGHTQTQTQSKHQNRRKTSNTLCTFIFIHRELHIHSLISPTNNLVRQASINIPILLRIGESWSSG